jgi:hypothetical protein
MKSSPLLLHIPIILDKSICNIMFLFISFPTFSGVECLAVLLSLPSERTQDAVSIKSSGGADHMGKISDTGSSVLRSSNDRESFP